jgi:hypothetical protein
VSYDTCVLNVGSAFGRSEGCAEIYSPPHTGTKNTTFIVAASVSLRTPAQGPESICPLRILPVIRGDAASRRSAALRAEPPTASQAKPAAAIAGKLRELVNAGDDACLHGTPMIPLHRDTIRAILFHLEIDNEA